MTQVNTDEHGMNRQRHEQEQRLYSDTLRRGSGTGGVRRGKERNGKILEGGKITEREELKIDLQGYNFTLKH